MCDFSVFADLVVLGPFDLIKHRAATITENIFLEGIAYHFKNAIKPLKLDHAAVMSHAWLRINHCGVTFQQINFLRGQSEEGVA